MRPAFAPLPVLRTPRLTLRPVRRDDCDALLALRSNASVNRYLARPKTPTADEVRAFIERLLADEAAYWAITENETVIGTICLFSFSDENRRGEVGFELHPDFQGRGLMREALAKILGFAARNGVSVVEGAAHQDNARSRALLEQAGFARDAAAELRLRDVAGMGAMTVYTLSLSPSGPT